MTIISSVSGVPGSRAVLGCMRIDALSDDRIRDLVAVARDSGITVFDHADIYGGERHTCERRFGQASGIARGEREHVVIQSKTGIRPGFYDSSAAHIRESVDGSLSALDTDYLDLLLIHRPDALADPDEIAAAFSTLHAAGKVRHFGVSNHTPAQVALLQRSVEVPLVANQVQFGLGYAGLVAAGITANVRHVDEAVDRDHGVLEQSRLHDITLQAWSPLQSERGGIILDREAFPELSSALNDVAEEHGTTAGAIASAWVTTHPARMQVVVGSTTAARVAEAAAGAALTLTREQWYRLYRVAGYLLP